MSGEYLGGRLADIQGITTTEQVDQQKRWKLAKNTKHPSGSQKYVTVRLRKLQFPRDRKHLNRVCIFVKARQSCILSFYFLLVA